jgi:DHA1 family multidrug resistance protein-like MFS transporter
MFGGAVVVLAMGFARNAEELVMLRALQGMITGVIGASNPLIVSVAPPERSGFALGTLQTALSSGLASGPIVGGILVDTVGFQAAFVITSVLMAIGGFLVLFGVRESFEPPAKPRRLGAMVSTWGDVLRTPSVGTTFTARFAAWLGRGALVPILPLFIPFLLIDDGNSGTFTGLVIGVAAATFTISAVALGDLGDRIGHRRVLIVSAAMAAACYAPMAFVQNGMQLLILNALAGFAFGGVQPSLSAMLNVVTEKSDVGSAFGLDNAVGAASRAVAPIVGVGLAALLGGEELGYRAVFISSSILLLGTIVIVSRMPPADAQSRTTPRPEAPP